MQRWAWYALAAIVAGGLSSCGSAKTVVVFGDSIAAGNTLASADSAQVWTRQVERLSAGRLRVIDESSPGRSTAATDEFERMLARRMPMDVLVLALGTNDSG